MQELCAVAAAATATATTYVDADEGYMYEWLPALENFPSRKKKYSCIATYNSLALLL